jgi:phosphatidylglycerophosphate synthase
MNLHRSGKEGQWKSVAEEDQNIAQKIAERTNGVVTPGNTISLAGATLVASGLHDISKGNIGKGVKKLGIGRTADIIDGMAAEATGTKSPVGEAADVIIDKVETAAALPILVSADVLPKPVAGVILAQNMANTAFSAVAKRRGVELHPSKEGKLSTAGQWATIGLYGLSSVARESDSPKMARKLEIAGHITAIATAALGAKAVFGYAQETLLPITETPTDFNDEQTTQLSMPVQRDGL